MEVHPLRSEPLVVVLPESHALAADERVALVPESVQHLRITGAAYRPLAGTSPTVELAVATRRAEASPAVRQVLEVARRLLQTDRDF